MCLGLFWYNEGQEIRKTKDNQAAPPVPHYIQRPAAGLSRRLLHCLGLGSHGLANHRGKARGRDKARHRYCGAEHERVWSRAQAVLRKEKKSLVSLVSSTRLKGQMESQ